MSGEPSRRRSSGSVRAPDETRARILDAAARAYAQSGYQGCTTRAIATAAGVNEVTLFRVFGSKEALLEAAIASCAPGEAISPLPDVPADPRAELTAWCTTEIERLRASRTLLRRCFAEGSEHPDHVKHAAMPMELLAASLRAYVARLHATDATRDDEAAIAMLIAALIADSLGRDAMPGVFPEPIEEAPSRYVETFLRAVARPDA
jgi:AcrR family transcriptional regulator